MYKITNVMTIDHDNKKNIEVSFETENLEEARAHFKELFHVNKIHLTYTQII